MSMDFVFDTAIDRSTLGQGDLVIRSDAVASALEQAHGYYASAPSYTHFIILTQSCDLVRRDGSFNAPYITIAAVRPLDEYLKKQAASIVRRVDGAELSVLTKSGKQNIARLLERILHNTQKDIFFLPADGTDALNQDLCAFLHLSIAMRKEHYEILLQDKIAQLSEVFRAKLGWMKGDIYSRVATPDVEERVKNASRYKKDFVTKYMEIIDVPVLSALQLSFARSECQKAAQDKGVPELPEAEARALMRQIPRDIDQIATEIVAKLAAKHLVDNTPEAKASAEKALKNLELLKRIVGSLS